MPAQIDGAKVFVTGSTGLLGTAVVSQLLAAGYQVQGLVRSDEAAKELAAKGATSFLGDLSDPAPICQQAAKADAVIHLAYNHDFTRRDEALALELALCRGMVWALAGSNKPLIISSGTGMFAPTPVPVDETETIRADRFPKRHQADEIVLGARSGPPLMLVVKGSAGAWPLRQGSVQSAKQGVRGMVIRLPFHCWGPGVLAQGTSKFMVRYGAGCKQMGCANYIGSVQDVARAYVLALEHGEAGNAYHLSGQIVSTRGIAEAVQKALGIDKPVGSITIEQATEVYGPFFQWVYSVSNQADASKARKQLGWHPQHVDDFFDGIAAAGAAGAWG